MVFRSSRAVVALAGLLACTALARAASAQSAAPRITLKAADATHAHEFTAVSSLRELSDGRVLATDSREQRLLVLDFRNGSAEEFGRKGQGPNEFGMVTALHAIAGDSSIMADIMGRRWLLLDGARIVVTVPPDDPAVQATQSAAFGADARGWVLTRRSPPRRDGVTVIEEGKEDSTAIVLVDRRTGRADTAAMTRNRPIRYERTTNAEGVVTRVSMMPTGPLVTEEQAVLFQDGTLAVARLDPFRVDWRSPAGEWTMGEPLPVPRIRVNARERAAFMERNEANFRPPAQPMPFPTPKRPESGDFPDFIPPFPGGAVRAGPAGTLLVRRSLSADYPDRNYFVIDRRGRLVGEFGLALGEDVVGVGPRSIYVSQKDEDDIVTIRRHPWP
jgi:hypothetical protein